MAPSSLSSWLVLALVAATAACATSGELDGGGGSGNNDTTGGESSSGGAGGGGAEGGGGAAPSCDDPPTASASSDGAVCFGDDATLTAETLLGADYAWTGPNGFSSNEASPTIADFGPEDVGTYSLVVTVDGCESEPATTELLGPEEMVALSQTTSAEFDENTNTGVDTAGDTIVLASALDFGTGANGAFSPTTSANLAGGTYDFTTVNIPAGVTITVTGNQPLIIRATGNVNVAGTIEASGLAGANGVTFNTFGVGAPGRAGGGGGGNGG